MGFKRYKAKKYKSKKSFHMPRINFGSSSNFSCYFRYIWPFLIAVGVTGLCILIAKLGGFDKFNVFINKVADWPMGFLFGNGESEGIATGSFWAFKATSWFWNLFGDDLFIRVLFLIVELGGCVIIFLGLTALQLILIVGGVILAGAWWLLLVIIGILLSLLGVALPGIMAIGYIVLVIILIRQNEQEFPLLENIIFILFTILQIAASVVFYLIFANIL